MTPDIAALRAALERATKGPAQARIVESGMPTDCCDYAVVSLSAGREILRTWEEDDARYLEQLLNSAPALLAAWEEQERLRKALDWALPLAEIALEDHRLNRIKYGHNQDIITGSGPTAILGLWPEEVAARNEARAALHPTQEPRDGS